MCFKKGDKMLYVVTGFICFGAGIIFAIWAEEESQAMREKRR